MFSENFENNINNTATGAQDYDAFNGALQYVGTTPVGQTYTGSAAWINGANCNGVILSANNSTLPAWANGGAGNLGNKCSPDVGTQSYSALRTLARALGIQFGGGDNNHVVSAYTECPGANCATTIGSGAVNGVMFKTKSLIPVTPNHFYSFSVNAAAKNCSSPGNPVIQASDPQWQLQLFDASNNFSNVGGIIDVCGPGETTLSVTNLQTAPFASSVNVYMQNLKAGPILFSGNALGVQMYNNSGLTLGNDAAFDNVAVTDVTPSIGKSFSPANLNVGDTSTLTFTFNNTTDLLAKNGWSFTDSLPANLVVAATPGVSTTCGSGTTTTATAGAGTISVTGGNLPAGASSCTISVNVTSNTAGTYTNGSANISSSAGLILPANASVTFNNVPDLKISKTHTPSSFMRGATGTYNLTVSNSGLASTAGTMTVTDTLPTGLAVPNGAVALSGTNAANWSCNAASNVITCTSSTAIAAGSSSTFGFNVNVSLTAASSVTNNVTVSGGGEPTANNGNNSASDVTATISQPAFSGCPSDGYLTRGTTGTDILLYSLNLGSGAMSPLSATFLPTLTNAIGFRQQDGYIWGWNNDVTGRRLVRIGSDGSAVMPFASAPAGLPAGQQFYIGDIQPSTGYYVGDSGTTLYYIDVTTNTVVSTVAHTDTTSTDIAFNPTDGNIYTVTNTTGAVMRINPVSGAVTSVGISLPMDASSRGWGGLFFDNQGTLYAYKGGIDAGNTSGAVYRVFNVDGSGTLSYDMPTTSLPAGNLDGARCSAAPPQGAPALIIKKTTMGAAGGPFGFTINNTVQTSGSVTTATAGTAAQVDGDPTLAGTQPFTVKSAAVNQPLTISENSLPTGWNLTGASCSIDGSPVGSLSGTTFTIPGSFVSSGSLIECSFTNSNAAPDLKIVKSSNGAWTTGQAGALYTLTITNQGSLATSGTVTVSDILPAGITPNWTGTNTVTSNGATWACTFSGQNITCTTSNSIPNTGTNTSLITLPVNISAAAVGTPINYASIGGGGDPYNGGTAPTPGAGCSNVTHCASNQTTVNPNPPNISLLKSCTLPANCTSVSQTPGTDLTYKIVFTNTGGIAAANMMVVDAVPINTDFKLGSAAATVGTTGLTFAIEYSSDYDPLNPAAATWTYTPVSAGGGASAGYDRLVKAVRWRVTAGSLSNTTPDNTGDVSFTTKIR